MSTSGIENSNTSTVGIRFGTSEETTFQLRGKAGWQHGFGDLTPTSNVRLASGSPFVTAGAPQSRNAGFGQIEALYSLSEGSSIGVSFDFNIGDASDDHALMAHVRIGF